MNLNILKTEKEVGYELLDSGNGEKLERFGDFLLRRPDPQALWAKNLSEIEWQKADATFVQNGQKAHWVLKNNDMPKKWTAEIAGLKFFIKLSTFKHTGVFPEQVPNWDFIKENVSKVVALGKKPKILNLFGYTGGATLASAMAGADVCHVDGSKTSITLAKENTELSGLKDKPIRWILDDARKFVEREIKRGVKYDGIIMDPPAFGHGAKDEVWEIEEDLLPLLDLCKKALTPEPLFIIINGYASGYSAITYKQNLEKLTEGFGGNFECGELTIAESKGKRLLPAGIYARWSVSE